jgi:SAM-dependent methyltransferase
MADGSKSGSEFEYIGEELEIFQFAENWKRYVAQRVRPYLTGHVLEVGAGLGANTPYLYRKDLQSFLSLEPDSQLCERYRQRKGQRLIPADCELVQGTLQAIPSNECFDSIVYFDVLEHIENDRAEIDRAFEHLRPGGHLVVLCPSYNWLYSPFDAAIGHFRRYNKQMYRRLTDRQLIRVEYLDSVGLLASIANKLILKQSHPNKTQIEVWDRVFVKLSKGVDRATFHIAGKSLLGIWRS